MTKYIDQDPFDIVFALLERREKQLKRVIKSARKWHDDAIDYKELLLEDVSTWFELSSGPEDV